LKFGGELRKTATYLAENEYFVLAQIVYAKSELYSRYESFAAGNHERGCTEEDRSYKVPIYICGKKQQHLDLVATAVIYIDPYKK
jgi:hypothetical protein